MKKIANKFWDGRDCTFLRCISHTGMYRDVMCVNINFSKADSIIDQASELSGYGIEGIDFVAAVLVLVKDNNVTKRHDMLIGVVKNINGTAFEFDEETLKIIGVAQDFYVIPNYMLKNDSISIRRDKLNN